MLEEDVVEYLHDLSPGQLPLQPRAAGQCPALELGDLVVPLRVVIPGVEHGPAGQRTGRKVGAGVQRDADHHQVLRGRRFLAGRRAGQRAELLDEVLQRLRAAGVAEYYLVAGGHAEPGHGTADHAAADDA